MKKNVIRRLEEEMSQYQRELESGVYTKAELVADAYQIAMKQEIVGAMQLIAEEGNVKEDVWKWLNHQEAILDYLYHLWMHCDVSFVQELADVFIDEVNYDREVCLHE